MLQRILQCGTGSTSSRPCALGKEDRGKQADTVCFHGSCWVFFFSRSSGLISFPGDVGRQLVLSIDDVKGLGAMLQLPAHANQTAQVQRRRASRGRRRGKGGDSR